MVVVTRSAPDQGSRPPQGENLDVASTNQTNSVVSESTTHPGGDVSQIAQQTGSMNSQSTIPVGDTVGEGVELGTSSGEEICHQSNLASQPTLLQTSSSSKLMEEEEEGLDWAESEEDLEFEEEDSILQIPKIEELLSSAVRLERKEIPSKGMFNLDGISISDGEKWKDAIPLGTRFFLPLTHNQVMCATNPVVLQLIFWRSVKFPSGLKEEVAILSHQGDMLKLIMIPGEILAGGVVNLSLDSSDGELWLEPVVPVSLRSAGSKRLRADTSDLASLSSFHTSHSDFLTSSVGEGTHPIEMFGKIVSDLTGGVALSKSFLKPEFQQRMVGEIKTKDLATIAFLVSSDLGIEVGGELVKGMVSGDPPPKFNSMLDSQMAAEHGYSLFNGYPRYLLVFRTIFESRLVEVVENIGPWIFQFHRSEACFNDIGVS